MKKERKQETVFSEAELRQAAAQVRESLLRKVTAEEEGETPFSPDFDRRTERSFRRRAAELRIQRLGQWAAVLLACLVTVAAMFVVMDPTARAAVLRWFRSEEPDTVTYEFAGPEEETPLPRFRPVWVPEGLTEQAEQCYPGPEKPVMRCVSYTPDGDPSRGFSLSYWYMQDGMRLEIGPTKPIFTREFVTVRGMYGELTLTDDPEEMNNLIWIDEERGIAFSIDTTLGREDLLHIAAGVQPAEEPE